MNDNTEQNVPMENIDLLSPDHFIDEYFSRYNPVLIRNIPVGDYFSFNEISKKIENDGSYNHVPAINLTENPYPDKIQIPPLVSQVLEHVKVSQFKKDYTRLWASPANHTTNFHYDYHGLDVFNLQLSGQKKWELIIPVTELPFHPFSNLLLPNSDLKNHLNTNIDKCYSFTTRPGDMIYVPAFCLHKVTAESNSININWCTVKKYPFNTDLTIAKRELEILKIALLCRDRFIYNRLVRSTGYGDDLFKLYASRGWPFIQEQTEQISKYSVLMRLMKEMKYYKYALSESWA